IDQSLNRDATAGTLTTRESCDEETGQEVHIGSHIDRAAGGYVHRCQADPCERNACSKGETKSPRLRHGAPLLISRLCNGCSCPLDFLCPHADLEAARSTRRREPRHTKP